MNYRFEMPEIEPKAENLVDLGWRSDAPSRRLCSSGFRQGSRRAAWWDSLGSDTIRVGGGGERDLKGWNAIG